MTIPTKGRPRTFKLRIHQRGPKGLILKRIQFTLVNRDQVFNLAFGDKDTVTGDIDDLSVSNNGDSEKVLATVVGAVYAFCDRHPVAWIYASGVPVHGQDFIKSA